MRRRQNMLQWPSLKLKVIVFGWVRMFDRVWHTSPLLRIQHLAFCGIRYDL